ncbi:MAG: hypothetical protein KGL39_56325 [Patescibacteria group bacterium]|nr:hypothetical protein [Patescibacteria group bacterium]
MNDPVAKHDSEVAKIQRRHQKDEQARLGPSSPQAAAFPPRHEAFSDFCAWLGVRLTEGQSDVVSACYDSAARKRVVVAVCGARGGKSYVLIALRLLHGAIVRDLQRLAPGERGVGLVVAPDLRLAKQVIGYVRGAIQTKAELQALVTQDSEFSITLRRPDGKIVSIEALPATRGGGAVRGRSLIDAALDECAFFRDEGYAVNDVEIYKAVAPRVLPGGQIILASTPWGEAGLLYDMWKQGETEHIHVVHAPTLQLNPSKAEDVSMERQRDPENARREFDAQFMTSGSGQYFDGNAIRQATVEYELPHARNPRYRYAVGVDLGFKSDSSACVVAEFDGDHYRIAYAGELRPSEGQPLVPSEVIATFAQVAKSYGAQHIITDGHYREAVAEHLRTHGLAIIDAPAGATGKLETYARTRAVLHQGRLVLPNHPRLLSQLRAVTSRPTAGGGVSILSPRKPGGGHGDLVSSLVLAVHHLATAQVQPAAEVVPAYGTPAYEQFLAIKAEKEMMDSDLKKYGRQNKSW